MDEKKRDKLFKILGALIEPEFHISNDCYLEMLITHLSGKGKLPDKDGREVLKSPKILDWLEAAVSGWEQGHCPEAHIMSFTVRLAALVIENEWQFSIVKEKQILERIQTVLKSLSPAKQTPSLQLANVVLLNAVAQHTMGLFWIKQKGVWRVIVEYCEKNQTVYVVRESLTFLYTILKKFSMHIADNEFCEDVLNTVCSPLIVGNPFKDLETKTHDVVILVDDHEQLSRIVPSLDMVCHIMHEMITSNECHEVAKLLVGKLNLEHFLWGLADLAQDHTFIGRIMRAHVLLNFTRSMLRRSEPNHEEADFNKFGVDFFNYMSFCVTRRSSMNIITMAEQYHSLWSQIKPPPPEEVVIEGERIKFEDQVVILQLLPIIYVIKTGVNRESLAEYLDSYIIKIFNISCGRTIRLIYAFRDILCKLDEDFVAHLATKSIQAVLAMKDTMHRARAVLVLQALVYTLQEFNPHCRKVRQLDLLLKSPQLLSAILTGLHTLIKSYRITWKECIESTVLVAFMLELLSNPNLSTRHAVQALQLIQLSIEHFLAPNLALLVDTLQGSGMENLGPVIYKKLHDNAWEIRDSTLELVASMIQLSKMKFPPFQKHILDSEICPIVYSLARHDGESYVRASALNCLTEMVNIPMFWDECLVNLDIVPYLMEVLYTESEGMVRREGVVLLSAIYEKNKLPKERLDQVFSIMAYCAVNDLYWEVKTNALKFWKGVMCRQFQHQGVIDNTFPAVTFSKEHKKIVQLTQKEILLRLTKVLNELSVRGCLGIFLHCLEDNSDLEVVKVASSIVQMLQTFLVRYHYLDEMTKLEPQTGAMDTNFIKSHSDLSARAGKRIEELKVTVVETRRGARRGSTGEILEPDMEDVIDAIVEAQDMNLLASAYESQLRVNASETPSPQIAEDYYKQFATVTTEQFLRKIHGLDLAKLAEIRSSWIAQIENFDSLLDDILLSFTDVKEVNDADCY